MGPGLVAGAIVGFGAVYAAHSRLNSRNPRPTSAAPSDFWATAAFTVATFGVAVAAGTSRQARRRLARLSEIAEIAEKHRAELEAVIDGMADSVVIFDLDGRIELMNAALARTSRQTRAGAPANASQLWDEYDLFDEDGRPVVVTERPAARLLRGEAFSNWPLMLRRRSTGEQSYVMLNGGPVRDHSGKQVLCFVAFHDVTSTAAAQRALRDSERRLQALADNIPQLAWIADAHGRVLWYNGRWVEYTGATVDHGPTWYDVHHPDHHERVKATIRHAIETGEAWEITTPLRDKNGQYRWFLSRGIGIRDETDSVVHWFGTATDVTGRVETEQALRDSEERCRSAAETLREVDRRKTEFLSMLSHELRNPLAPIRTSLTILERVVPGSEQAKRAQMVIGRQVAHLARLVDDLLDVTRIERGKIRLQREEIELNSIMRRAADDYRSSFSERNVALEVQTDPEPIYIDGDPIRIAQIVGNLLTNAAKFTPPGGRTVMRLKAADESNAELSILDTGIGMSKATLEQAFEPFTQADRTLDRSRGGLGLGLTLVKALVELHGGTVKARSEGIGFGTEIIVCLPIKPRWKAVPALQQSAESPPESSSPHH